MKKTIFALVTLALFTLEAEQFQVKTSSTASHADPKRQEYLVRIEIDQISDNSAPVEFAKKTIVCKLGKESTSKFAGGIGDCTMKAFVYQADEKTKLKTSVTILDAQKKVIFHSDEDKEL